MISFFTVRVNAQSKELSFREDDESIVSYHEAYVLPTYPSTYLPQPVSPSHFSPTFPILPSHHHTLLLPLLLHLLHPLAVRLTLLLILLPPGLLLLRTFLRLLNAETLRTLEADVLDTLRHDARAVQGLDAVLARLRAAVVREGDVPAGVAGLEADAHCGG